MRWPIKVVLAMFYYSEKVIIPPTASPSIDPRLRMEKFLVQIVSIITCHSYTIYDLASSTKMPVSLIALSACGNLQQSTLSQVIWFG